MGLLLWILLNGAKLNTKHGLIILGRTEAVGGKTCKFKPASYHHPKNVWDSQCGVWTSPSVLHLNPIHIFLRMATNEVLIVTYFHYCFWVYLMVLAVLLQRPFPNFKPNLFFFTTYHKVNQKIFSGAHTERLLSLIERSLIMLSCCYWEEGHKLFL